MTPCPNGKARSRSGSGSESSSSISTSVSSSSGDTEEDEPSKLAKTKSAHRNVKSEEVAPRAKKRPHFYLETSGHPPRVLPTKATRQEKHKCSDAHQQILQILEKFLEEYDSSQGHLVHHYKECCKTTLQKVCTLCMSFVMSLDMSLAALTFIARVLRVLRVVSNHVPGALAAFHASSLFSG